VRLDTSLERLLERGAGEPCVLATVVATAGSTYGKPGARMLIFADGGYLGLLSGGCLEADLRLHAQEVLESGATRAVEYDMRGPDDILFGLGAGCEGAMRVLLEPAGRAAGCATAALEAAGRATREGMAACLVCVHESTEVPLGTYGRASLPPPLAALADACLAEGSSREVTTLRDRERLRAFVQFLAPPPHLLICGAGPDAQPVVAAARAVGWRVSVVDHRPAYADARRFPQARVIRADAGDFAGVDLGRVHAAVVMSHHLDSDVRYLRALARAGAPGYVGLLGPVARRRRIARELGELAAVLAPRLKSPVGIDIGAVTPEGIALAIVAEVHGWLAGRPRGEFTTLETAALLPEEA
jgi:xanthine dehydrogenase accessory factor